jgi:hypothetical protein
MSVRNSHHPAAPAWAEPSWSQVLATTVRLWTQRRLTARRWQLVAVSLALAGIAAAALQVAGVFTRTALPATRAPSPASRSSPAVTGARAEAAAWIAEQVSDAAMVGCDPVMCAALQAQGVAAGRLVPLRTGSADPRGANVVVTSASTDAQIAGQYAPALIASFGSGPGRIQVRATEPGGAAAYARALRSDLAARKAAGSQLLRNWHLQFSSQSAAQIRAGQVDSRLLATLAALAAHYRVRVTAFSDAAPGNSGIPGAQQPFRQVTINANQSADLGAALAVVHAQVPPYLPAQSAIAGHTLSIEFAAPSPLGLLTPVLTDFPQRADQTRGD